MKAKRIGRGPLARFIGESEGSMAVEFALGAMALIFTTFGVMDVSNMMRIQDTLETVSKDGSRYAAIHGSSAPIPQTDSEIEAYARKISPALDPAVLTVTVKWNSTYPSDYPDTTLAGQPNKTPGNTVTVTATYPYEHFLASLLPPMTLKGESTYIITG